MTLAALIGGPIYLHLGRAGAVRRHHGRHGVPRPFARHAPAADSPLLRLPAVAGAAVRLSRHAGRHGRPLRHDPPARHPRLGAAQARLPPLSGASLVDAARRLLAAALRSEARPSAAAGDGAARRRGPLLPLHRAHLDGAAAAVGRCCSSRSAACRGWCGASRRGWRPPSPGTGWSATSPTTRARAPGTSRAPACRATTCPTAGSSPWARPGTTTTTPSRARRASASARARPTPAGGCWSALEKLGLVWNLKTPEMLPHRPNLVALHQEPAPYGTTIGRRFASE